MRKNCAELRAAHPAALECSSAIHPSGSSPFSSFGSGSRFGGGGGSGSSGGGGGGGGFGRGAPISGDHSAASAAERTTSAAVPTSVLTALDARCCTASRIASASPASMSSGSLRSAAVRRAYSSGVIAPPRSQSTLSRKALPRRSTSTSIVSVPAGGTSASSCAAASAATTARPIARSISSRYAAGRPSAMQSSSENLRTDSAGSYAFQRIWSSYSRSCGGFIRAPSM